MRLHVAKILIGSEYYILDNKPSVFVSIGKKVNMFLSYTNIKKETNDVLLRHKGTHLGVIVGQTKETILRAGTITIRTVDYLITLYISSKKLSSISFKEI